MESTCQPAHATGGQLSPRMPEVERGCSSTSCGDPTPGPWAPASEMRRTRASRTEAVWADCGPAGQNSFAQTWRVWDDQVALDTEWDAATNIRSSFDEAALLEHARRT
mmetsp:Transcript_31436/g.104230  ORF Transcript_31436/g.104230 Transcript_31436/m.104230 type:complete len:108 (+) Transcript_31436:750-1073(+)